MSTSASGRATSSPSPISRPSAVSWLRSATCASSAALAIVEPTIAFAVVGMGKLGGAELNYSSDIDVLFVHDGDGAEADRVARVRSSRR